MSAYSYQNVPQHLMSRFRAVRCAADNLWNLLVVADAVNTCSHLMTRSEEGEFNLRIYSGSYSRALIVKDGGYFSMAIPFQIIDDGDRISFNSDGAELPVSGIFLAALKNSVTTWNEESPSPDSVLLSLVENFGVEFETAMRWTEEFISLLSNDHGFMRFDDDPKNENGIIHPRFHFDFFFSNHSSAKIGLYTRSTMDCFTSLFDKNLPKHYLREHAK
ncbi:hypothetical protein [Stenotrophomonas sp. CC120223-11]|uniref:hypothetical protein n=1 Tax=unclassified Stenotrophomonas TaxID=196198 RepID=UPI000BC41FE0|nr:hypothetical protein [Stenotrophomonas sp. CC120223-11]SNY65053.1 hypothetical protein SAMN02744784_01515 [Stenotrophomonas sp. CC120223-11]